MTEIEKRYQWEYMRIPKDRTGLVEGVEDVSRIRPIPSIVPTKSLPELMKERAREFIERDKPIYLLWSGGIDSTGSLYALLDAGIEFQILYNKSSLREYPWLGNQLQTGQFDQIKVGQFQIASQLNPADCLYITGEIGGHLFGSDDADDYTYEERQRYYKDVLPVEKYEGFDAALHKVLGREDLTTSEFLWANNMFFKYMTAINRIGTYRAFIGGEIEHFYDTPQFCNWSMNNYQTTCNYKDSKDSKRPLKDYIYDQNGDKVYYDTKDKQKSLTGGNSETWEEYCTLGHVFKL